MKPSKMISSICTSTLITAFFFTSASLNAQSKTDTKMVMMKDYCVMKDGKMMRMKAGKMMTMEKNMTMKNGTICMVNGECAMKDGTKMLMKEGECMDMDGNVAKSPKELKAKAEMQAMANYACPMHPEVTSDKPGKCTKCGMALVKKKQIPVYGICKNNGR